MERIPDEQKEKLTVKETEVSNGQRFRRTDRKTYRYTEKNNEKRLTVKSCLVRLHAGNFSVFNQFEQLSLQ